MAGTAGAAEVNMLRNKPRMTKTAMSPETGI